MITNRERLFQLRSQLHSRDTKTSENQDLNNSQCMESLTVAQLDFENDTEINQILESVFVLEKKIESQLNDYDFQNDKIEQTKDCLDNSFDTIALLMEEVGLICFFFLFLFFFGGTKKTADLSNQPTKNKKQRIKSKKK